MSIGPDSRRMASGRVVVVTGLLGVVGAAAVVIGLGPILQPSEPMERVLAVGAIALGTVMIIAALALAIRRGPSRQLGIAGGWAMLAMGLTVAVLSAASLGTCEGRASQVVACQIVIATISVVGISIAVAGGASVAVIRRARPVAPRGRRR